MKYLLFENFRQWRICLWAGVCKMSWGTCRIITCIIFGIVSIFVFCCKEVEKFGRREPVASLIIVLVVVFLSFGWIVTFVRERAARTNAESQRDVMSMKLDSAKQCSIIKIDKEQLREYFNDNGN